MNTPLIFVGILSLACLGQAATPSQAEVDASFVGGMGASVPQVVAQEQIHRRLADIMLGHHVASSFQQMAMLEFQAKSLAAAGVQGYLADDEFDDDDEVLAEEFNESNLVGDLASDSESDSDQVNSLLDLEKITAPTHARRHHAKNPSFLELKEEFVPGMMGMGMGMGMGMQQQPQHTSDPDELEHMASFNKLSALKAMHVQYYFAGGDVERSHWVNKMLSYLLPPQMTVFKLYKSYINTMALSLAYQFHDSFTFEAYVDDFNDRFVSSAAGSDVVEAWAEHGVYSKWYSISMMKWQLFMLSMYERSMMSHGMSASQQSQQQQAFNAAATASFVEEESNVDSQFVGGSDPHALVMQYMYMNYYSMFLKMYAMMAEMQVAQGGMMAAMIKVQSLSPSQDVSFDATKSAEYLTQLESKMLPSAIHSWASINLMRYAMEYFSLMIEMQIPPIAASAAAERAENTFQNLIQSGPAQTTTTPPADAAPATEAAPAPAPSA